MDGWGACNRRPADARNLWHIGQSYLLVCCAEEFGHRSLRPPHRSFAPAHLPMPWHSRHVPRLPRPLPARRPFPRTLRTAPVPLQRAQSVS